MLNHQTMDKLLALRLEGMAQALEEQRRQADISQLDFEERFALLVERNRPAAPSYDESGGYGRMAG